MTESPPDIDDLDITSLKALVLELLEDQAALRAGNAVLREEIRRLKGLSGPPDIKPSGMDGEARSRGVNERLKLTRFWHLKVTRL